MNFETGYLFCHVETNESKTNTRQPLKWSVMCSFCFVLSPR
nr:MAG TPA: hypothetical protein [Caudoviricetes sp.]